MKVIGLTGGIASGKSTIANLLRSLGAPVFDADAESRALVAKGRAALNEIALTFGIEYLTDGGELNRRNMAELVFHEKEALKKLEAIIHIFKELDGTEGILVASKVADRVGITRSVIVNALRKFESAGVIESRSSGMKGTYIKVLNDYVFTELERIEKERM